MDSTAERSGWARFWDHGRWWKALILAVGYLAIYEPASLLMAPFVPFIGGADSASYVIVLIAVPVLIGSLILVGFGASVGWLRSTFERQTPRGGGWMWIAIAVVLLFNVMRFASIDYSAAGFDWVAAWLLAGLVIGFSEELLTRGYVVRIMRSSGRSEIAVGMVSAALFALLHATNLFIGQPLLPTLLQILYTFFFGFCMYLAMRVTRTIIAPILLHASTDPSIFMQGTYPAAGPLSSFAQLGNIVVILVGVVLLVVFLITERRAGHRAGTARHEAAQIS
ncbi:CPBP family intramembrane metalloprotease [Rathayibacter sp. VKM Ac-2803]|uniref:CPBP family intramembrane glutamic endopeptidase n=1 Tax=unclassified Rathayibacter TaxID=2609250 RepID=UPI00135BBC08|nr:MULTISPECIES: CPBP family intramembrane glutamic endopeptidase [unclassified Rathayibacter]MWV48561.1 CPBP family intramembrane metalloprotease [Rathayibacter sp. VKM Ac-2803]MWV60101.1 CPBP family intramembrane metalloprotease [Rathayibacter sp. VKM Ac-2754]